MLFHILGHKKRDAVKPTYINFATSLFTPNAGLLYLLSTARFFEAWLLNLIANQFPFWFLANGLYLEFARLLKVCDIAIENTYAFVGGCIASTILNIGSLGCKSTRTSILLSNHCHYVYRIIYRDTRAERRIPI